MQKRLNKAKFNPKDNSHVVGYFDEAEIGAPIGRAPYLHPTPNRDFTTPVVRLSDYEKLLKERDELLVLNERLSGPIKTLTVYEKGKPFSFMAQDPCRYSLCEVTYARPVYTLIEQKNKMKEALELVRGYLLSKGKSNKDPLLFGAVSEALGENNV